MAHNGSVQKIKDIPDDVKKIYKTVWEIPQKTIINMAVRRAPFIDQSQSLNIHLVDASLGKMASMHFYAWRSGLKTGMYYLRTKPAVDAIKFTLNMEELLKATDSKDPEEVLKHIGNNDEDDDKENKIEGTPKINNTTYQKVLSEKELEVLDKDEGCINCGS